MNDGKVSSSDQCVTYLRTGGFCPVGNLCIFRHGGFSLTADPSEPAPAPIRSQARAQKASPQLRFVDPVPNPPQSSGTSNQQTKSKKKKKQNEKREETGGPNSLSTNASAEREKSKKQDEKSRKVTIRSANGGRTWILDLTFLTQRSKALKNMFEHPTNNLRGLVRHRESNNLELDGVEAGHFSLFLSALRAGSRFDFSFNELKIILPLASDWGFSELRNRCMKTIQRLRPSPVDKLLLARRSQIPDWIREAYLTLAIRTPGLTTADAQTLGATAMAIIARAREEILLHRLQILTLGDPASRTSQCESPSRACREALCEIRLALLATKTKVPKHPERQGRLFLKHVLWLGAELCDTCKSDAAIGRTICTLDEGISVAKSVFDDEIGPENSKWLENA